MLYVPNDNHDCFYNMAMEEYIFFNMNPTETYILLWQNDPTIVVGRFQNTVEEVNRDYIMDQGIKVVRRLSGGGAVYHDRGNLNFTFIEPRTPGKDTAFEFFTEPVIAALKELGLDAAFSSRNDITVGDKKISGNAQYMTSSRVLHHGTLLVDTDFSILAQALQVNPAKIASKGIKSVRSRVGNIADFFSEPPGINELKRHLLKHIFREQPVRTYFLSASDKKAICRLAREKYATWDWVWGRSPKYNFRNGKRFGAGQIEIRLDVQQGRIYQAKIYGDFFGHRDLSEIEQQLCGLRFEPADIEAMLSALPLTEYFGPVSLDELMSLFRAC
ncbi:MAG TPA: lipoate--protein ligase [bacterium]|jgi:lipoate-protein ligase A|nr:lipoate--protein ligase [bacterium]